MCGNLEDSHFVLLWQCLVIKQKGARIVILCAGLLSGCNINMPDTDHVPFILCLCSFRLGPLPVAVTKRHHYRYQYASEVSRIVLKQYKGNADNLRSLLIPALDGGERLLYAPRRGVKREISAQVMLFCLNVIYMFLS